MIANSETLEFYGYIPPKPLYSYILYLFPLVFIFPPLMRWFVRTAMKNAPGATFEPGFRFYYGYNIHAKNVFFGDSVVMDYAPVYIGEGTSISRDNKIITSTHDPYDRNKIIAKPVKIGKNVWISTNCVILGGVTIGDNCIIGAGCVVAKDIPPNSVVVGNPCKIVKTLDENREFKSFRHTQLGPMHKYLFPEKTIK